MQQAMFDTHIILTEKLPIGSDQYISPEHDNALHTAGIYTWYWDLLKNRIFISHHIKYLIPSMRDIEPLTLNHFIHEVLDKKDSELFIEILDDFFNKKKRPDMNFKIYSQDDTPEGTWIRVSGDMLSQGDEIYAALGHFQNISESVNLKTSLIENQNFLDTLINLIPTPIYYKNLDGAYQFFNKAFEEVHSQETESIIGTSVYDLYSLEQAQRFTDDDKILLEEKNVHIYENLITFNDGTVRDFIIHKAPDISQITGKPKGIAGFMMDITEQKKAYDRIDLLMGIKELVLEINHAILSIPDLNSLLAFILKKLPNVIKCADCGTILLNSDGMLSVSASFGYKDDAAESFSFPLESSFMYTNGTLPDKPIIINNLQNLFRDSDYPPLLETQNGQLAESFLGSPIIRNGRILGLFSFDSFRNNAFTMQDVEVMEYLNEQLAVILDKQELYQKVLGLSRFDKLTSLSNRHYFQEQAENAIIRARRKDEEVIFLLADINSLKQVNDYWGHEAGDSMITTFAGLLKDSFRDSDILGRFGGDEFTGAFLDTTEEDIEKRFIEFSENPPLFPVKDGFVECRFSFGTAVFPHDSENLDELLRIADERMYMMKEESKRKRGVVSRESMLICQ